MDKLYVTNRSGGEIRIADEETFIIDLDKDDFKVVTETCHT